MYDKNSRCMKSWNGDRLYRDWNGSREKTTPNMCWVGWLIEHIALCCLLFLIYGCIYDISNLSIHFECTGCMYSMSSMQYAILLCCLHIIIEIVHRKLKNTTAAVVVGSIKGRKNSFWCLLYNISNVYFQTIVVVY